MKNIILMIAWALTVGLLAESSEAAKKKESKKAASITEATKKKFATANPEDITNENFPDLIESFDYPNADISEVVKAISKLTGKNFIIDPGAARGKITIIAPSQITVAEAYKAFLSALAINGLTVVPSGKFLKIRKARAAQTDSIETYTDYFPNTDQIITRIIKLKYISAEEVDKKIRILKSKDGQMSAYGPTNSLIITDYGSNIQRVVSILSQLDVPGFEEQLSVIRIEYAKSKDIASLIEKIINKDKNKSSSRFSSVPRFRRRRAATPTASRGAESYSLVVSDDRSNSIIVMGNKAGLSRIRSLVKKLDFPIRPEDAGGVHVYYVRHGDADKIANVLNGLASQAQNNSRGFTPRSSRLRSRLAPPTKNSSSKTDIFGGSVKIVSDKDTNSLIITASKQDYKIVKNLLAKMDIPRDQVFVKAIIMEISATKATSWGISYFKLDEASKGAGRAGFFGSNLGSILSPLTQGAILNFGSGSSVEVAGPGGATVKVPSLAGIVSLLKTHTGANVLSAPQITALDNEAATIEVGQEIPVGRKSSTGPSGISESTIERKKATIKLKITPYISPDTESVRMNIEQTISQLTNETVRASELNDASVVTNERAIDTSIVVNSGDTAVLGGLMQDIKDESVIKVPILGDIPIIGWLFKNKTSNKVKRNLIMFITPKIIRSAQDSNEIVNKKLDERINFIQSYMGGEDPHGHEIDKLPRNVQKTIIDSDKDDSDNLDF